MVVKAQKKNNLFVFENTINSCFYSSVDNFMKWHNRYGHLNFSSLQKLSSKKLVCGLDVLNVPQNINCKVCMESKICAQAFPQVSQTRSKELLELIHTDVCGPINKPSVGGSRYFVTFIDDMSRQIFVYFIKSKGEVFDKFKLFKAMVECQTDRKIKAIRSDNGSI